MITTIKDNIKAINVNTLIVMSGGHFNMKSIF